MNRKSPRTDVSEFRPSPETAPILLATVLAMDDAEFRRRFRGTPLFHAKRKRLIRNALIAVANQGLRELKPLVDSLSADAEELIRQTAKWTSERLDEIHSNEVHRL